MKPVSIGTLGLIAALSATFGLATVEGASAQPAAPTVVAQQTAQSDATSGSPSAESQTQSQGSQDPFNDESDNGPEFGWGQ